MSYGFVVKIEMVVFEKSCTRASLNKYTVLQNGFFLWFMVFGLRFAYCKNEIFQLSAFVRRHCKHCRPWAQKSLLHRQQKQQRRRRRRQQQQRRRQQRRRQQRQAGEAPGRQQQQRRQAAAAAATAWRRQRRLTTLGARQEVLRGLGWQSNKLYNEKS